MATVTLLACDLCELTDGVSKYEVHKEGVRSQVDLCETHGAPFEEVLNRFGQERKVKPYLRSTNRVPVMTLEEIEELKKKEKAGLA